MKIAIVLGLLLSLPISVNAQNNPIFIRADMTDQDQNGIIMTGEMFTIDISILTDVQYTVYGFGMTYSIYSPDGCVSELEHVNVGGYSADSIAFGVSYNDSSILTFNNYDNYSTLLRLFYGLDWNSNLPDSIHIYPASITGFPHSQVFVHYISLAVRSEEIGTICIDSADSPIDVYDWVFDYPGAVFNGPYCWSIVEPGNWQCSIEDNSFIMLQAYNVEPEYTVIELHSAGMGYTVTDIIIDSIRINQTMFPDSLHVIENEADPGLSYIELKVNLHDFLTYYEPVWGQTNETYWVTFNLDNGNLDVATGEIEIEGHRQGDLNIDGKINLMDVVYFLEYIYSSGPAPLPVDYAGDVNCLNGTNIMDVIYLISYLYKNGPEPTCPQ